MRLSRFALVVVLCASGVAQEAPRARGIYARNGVLIGLTELSPLRDCSVRTIQGKVKTVGIEGDTVNFEIKSDDRRERFRFPLSRLEPAERKALRGDFLHKRLRLRATGYACGAADEPLETIRIDRSY